MTYYFTFLILYLLIVLLLYNVLLAQLQFLFNLIYLDFGINLLLIQLLSFSIFNFGEGVNLISVAMSSLF